MKTYEPDQIRNIGLYGHQGSGKTTVADGMCYLGESTSRLCSVNDGNSNFDFEKEEIRRRSSVSSAIGFCDMDKYRVNIIDNPGDTNFWAEPVMSLIGADLGIVTISAVDGLQVGTKKAYKLLAEAGIPRVIFVSMMDRERSDFDKTLAQLTEEFGGEIVPLAIPVGSESSFSGVVDLMRGNCFSYTGDGKRQAGDIPDDMADAAEGLRETLVEKLAEQDDDLMEKYFAEDDLGLEDLRTAMGIGLKSGSVIPVIAGNGSSTAGIDILLDIVTGFGPSPLDRKTFKTVKDDSEEDLEVSTDGPFLGHVFKTMVDVKSGRITIVRVVSGSMSPDGTFQNVSTGAQERYGQIFKLLGKKQEPAGSAATGDIVAMVKLKGTKTGHTISSEKGASRLATQNIPERCIALALKPKTQGDEDKVSSAVQKLVDEDVGLNIARDDEARDLLLEGLGQVHIETAVERMKRKFGVDCELKPRHVPYRETIRGTARKIEGKHKKQTGGHGQFGVCYIDLDPLSRGDGFVFEDAIFGGSIPKQYIPSVEKGIRDAMTRGVVAGYHVVDVKVKLLDGKFHDVDSDNRSFELAGSRAFKAAFTSCKPIILEPIMNMTIMIPDEDLGDIMGDISSRRGRVQGMDAAAGNQVVKAAVPMAEVLGYASDLRSMTSDRGSFTMEFSNYEELPANLAEKLTKTAQLVDDED